MDNLKNSLCLVFSFIFILSIVPAQHSFAVPVMPSLSATAGPCDPLVVFPTDELGIGVSVGGLFPAGEEISSAEIGTEKTACTTTFDSPVPNPLVDITNLNGIPFTEVWYVADVSTTLSNIDVMMTGASFPTPAFRIDAVGVNTPLFAESMTLDGIFEPGETWTFIIQDYSNPALPPSALGTIGVPSPSITPDGSSGSIVAIPVGQPDGMAVGGDIVPLDTTMVLVAGAQYTAAWMIPVIVSGIGFAIVIARKF